MSKRFVDTGDMFLVKGWFYIQKEEGEWILREKNHFQNLIKFGIYPLINSSWPEYLRMYAPKPIDAPKWWGLPNRTFYHDTVYFGFGEAENPENYCLSSPCFKALVNFLRRNHISETHEKL